MLKICRASGWEDGVSRRIGAAPLSNEHVAAAHDKALRLCTGSPQTRPPATSSEHRATLRAVAIDHDVQPSRFLVTYTPVPPELLARVSAADATPFGPRPFVCHTAAWQ